jgi:signal transduction histidine kinase
MISVSRRVLLYWLLLLIPTLIVGAGAFWLVQREEARINEHRRAADTARRAAIEARTRLIAENIEVIVSDVQAGLMATLNAAPDTSPAAFLSEWRRANPLVRDTFQASGAGRLLWGRASDATLAWLATSPWREPAPHPAAATTDDELARANEFLLDTPPATAPARRRDQQASADNVGNFNLARQELQQVAKVQNRADYPLSAPAAPPPSSKIADTRHGSAGIPARDITHDIAAKNARAPALASSSATTTAASSARSSTSLAPLALADSSSSTTAAASSAAAAASAAEITAAPAAAPPTRAAELSFDETSSPIAKQHAEQRAGAQSKIQNPKSKSPLPLSLPLPAPERTGWTPWRDASGTPHLHGWRLSANGTVLVVEIDLDAIASRLRDVLPVNIESDEAYAIGEIGHPPTHTVGRIEDAPAKFSPVKFPPAKTARQPAITLPVSASLLPGWAVAGYAAPAAAPNGGRAFFLLGTLLVATIVIAILAGGALLVRQARLSAAESAQKTSFVANVSHELKTPLTTIRLYAELLEQGRVRDEARRAGYLQTISRETQRLARLVNNVLDFSRLEQGRKKLDLAPRDLREEIARILDRHAPRLAEAGLRLDLLRPAAPCIVTTDLDAVEQIIINLLDNACKYAAAGGEVTVTLSDSDAGAPPVNRSAGIPARDIADKFQAKREACHVHAPAHDQTVRAPARGQTTRASAHGQTTRAAVTITVSDRGPGIPPAHRALIFEKFHRVDDTLTAAQGGAGLGLSIARQLARALGGELTHSPREGGGSEFTLTLRT